MSISIKENISANIKTAIAAITAANGFNQDLAAERPRRNDFSDIIPKDLTVLIKQAEEVKPEKQAYSTTEWYLPFAIMAIVLDDDDETDSIEIRMNQVEADIQKKLMEDPTRGGNAIDTIILPSVEFDDNKGFTGIAVYAAVAYRVQETDPYTQA